MANGISAGWSGLYNEISNLTPYGQINNTWGEVTTGGWATVNVSRLINMHGNGMSINVSTGCVSNLSKCWFGCKSGNTCWESKSYNLNTCDNGSQHGATLGWNNGDPTGGCQGFANGGHIDVTFYDH